MPRGELAIHCRGLGGEQGETYAIHSPTNLSTAADNPVNFYRRELGIIGHWSATTRMPELYDRIACATERLPLNAIAQEMISGRAPVDWPHLPVTVLGFERAGRSDVFLGANGRLEGSPAPSEDVGGAQLSIDGHEAGTSVRTSPSTGTQDDVVLSSPHESDAEPAPPKAH